VLNLELLGLPQALPLVLSQVLHQVPPLLLPQVLPQVLLPPCRIQKVKSIPVYRYGQHLLFG
jgi:hypothetical protein